MQRQGETRFSLDSAEPHPIFAQAKITKGESKGKGKQGFHLDYAEPHPIFAQAKITKDREFQKKDACLFPKTCKAFPKMYCIFSRTDARLFPKECKTLRREPCNKNETVGHRRFPACATPHRPIQEKISQSGKLFNRQETIFS